MVVAIIVVLFAGAVSGAAPVFAWYGAKRIASKLANAFGNQVQRAFMRTDR